MLRLALLAGAAGPLAAGGGGCVGYTANPSLSSPEFSNPNSPSAYDVMQTACRWVVRRYPPTPQDDIWGTMGDDVKQPFAVNLPPGLRGDVAARMLGKISSQARPVTAETDTLPIYHITRWAVTGDEATVDVLKPVYPFTPGPNGRPLYQGVTVKLRGGINPWHVTGHRVWTMGSVPAPELNYAGSGSGSGSGTGGPAEPGRADRPEPAEPEPDGGGVGRVRVVEPRGE